MTNTYDLTNEQSKNQLIGKVYGYMFFGLLITAIISIGVGLLFNIWIFGTLDPSAVDYSNPEVTLSLNGVMTLLVMLVVCSIALLILSFVIHITFLRGKHSLMAPALAYCILMGLVLSELIVFVPYPVLGITFGVTSGIFGIMYLIARVSKGNLSALGILGFGLLIGAGLLSLIGFILSITGVLGSEAAMRLYWIVSLVSFAAIMFITIWDMWRINKIAEQGEMSDNLVLYCAFTLYVDFIYMFLRVLRIVSYFYSKK